MKKPLKGTGGTLSASDILQEARSVILPPLTREEKIASLKQVVEGRKEFVNEAEKELKHVTKQARLLVKVQKKKLREKERELKKLEGSYK